MARVCEICNKTRSTGNNVSHSKRRTKRVFLPNILTTHVVVNGQNTKLSLCSRCLKTLSKTATNREKARAEGKPAEAAA